MLLNPAQWDFWCCLEDSSKTWFSSALSELTVLIIKSARGGLFFSTIFITSLIRSYTSAVFCLRLFILKLTCWLMFSSSSCLKLSKAINSDFLNSLSCKNRRQALPFSSSIVNWIRWSWGCDSQSESIFSRQGRNCSNSIVRLLSFYIWRKFSSL